MSWERNSWFMSRGRKWKFLDTDSVMRDSLQLYFTSVVRPSVWKGKLSSVRREAVYAAGNHKCHEGERLHLNTNIPNTITAVPTDLLVLRGRDCIQTTSSTTTSLPQTCQLLLQNKETSSMISCENLWKTITIDSHAEIYNKAIISYMNGMEISAIPGIL